MVKYRKKRYRKKRWNYGRFMTNAGKTAATALTALRLAKQVKGMVNVEYKFFDNSYTLNPDNSTLAVEGLNAIGQSDAVNGREGNKIRCKSIQMNFTVKKHASATNTVVRLLLLMSKDKDTAPTVTTIIDTVTGSERCLNPRADVGRKDFVTLKDWTCVFQANQEIKRLKYYKRCSIPITWTSSTSTAFKENALYLVALSNEATNTPTINGYSRLRYVDN